MKQPARVLTDPQPGLYTLRLVPKGWPVAARLDRSVDGIWSCWIDGERVPGEWTQDGLLEMLMMSFISADEAAPIARLIVWGIPCDEATYQHRLAMKVWALMHSPRHPAANPRKSIDASTLAADDF